MDFSKKPSDVVQLKSGPVSYIDYYQNNYQISIKDTNQPLLIHRSKTKIQGETVSEVNLIPQCNYWMVPPGLGPGAVQSFNLPISQIKGFSNNYLFQVERQIHLVPEVCYMTGLTDNMRSDFRIMQDLAQYTRQDPEKRNKALLGFRETIAESNDATNLLNRSGVSLSYHALIIYFNF